MIVRAFCIYDTKVAFYHTPFFFPHVGQAVRAVVDAATDPGTQLARHPADFVLMEIGTFDDQVGEIYRIPPVSHGPILSMLPRQQQPFPFPATVEE